MEKDEEFVGLGVPFDIADAIIGDLAERRGLRQAWEEIDPAIQREIRSKWAELARAKMR